MNRYSSEFPTPVALAVGEWERETHPFRRLHRLVDAYEALIKYCAIIAIQNFYSAKLAQDFPEVMRDIRQNIARPTLGNWTRFLENVLRCFAERKEDLFCSDLFFFCFQGYGSDPEFQPWFQKHGANDRLLSLRNQYVGHGATVRDEEAKEIVREHEKYLRTLLEQATFLCNLPLYQVVEHRDTSTYRLHPLIGEAYQQKRLEEVKTNQYLPLYHIVVQNPQTGQFLDLYPLLVFTKCNHRRGRQMICGERKVLFFNELRASDSIALLDYWLGHHSRYRNPHKLPEDFRSKFRFASPKDETPNSKTNWFEERIEHLTAHFVGREKELQRFEEFIQHPRRKVLVVFGAPGMGKSTLLARWAKERNLPRHFLQEGDTTTLEPTAVFSNLCRQISERYQVRFEAPKQQEPTAYRQAFDALLREASAKSEEPIVVTIDGLDEAVRSAAQLGKSSEQTDTILNYLPSPQDLPEGVRMVLSSRPDLKEHRSFKAKYDHDKAEHLEIGRMSADEVRAILYQVWSKYEVIANEPYVNAVVERSEGSPLYLRMLAEDLAEGRITFGDIDQLPQGVVSYFERILEFIENEGRHRDMPDVETLLKAKKETLEGLVADGILTQEQAERQLHREQEALRGRAGLKSVELLALFALAKAPLTLEEAIQILQVSEEEGHRAFEVIRTVLTESSLEEWVLFHSAFQEYLLHLNEYTEDNLHRHRETIERVQEKLIAYCARWHEHKSLYALRHYPDHLYELQRYDELFALARNREFEQTQVEMFPEELNLPLRGKALALQSAAKLDDAKLIAEFLLSHASTVETIQRQETPLQVLKRTGSLNRAIELAKTYETERQSVWLLLLAWELKDRGQKEEAVKILKMLQERVERREIAQLRSQSLFWIKPTFDVREWYAPISKVLLTHLVDVSGEAVGVIARGLLEGDQLPTIGYALAKAGEAVPALQVALLIENEGEKDEWEQAELVANILVSELFRRNENPLYLLENLENFNVKNLALVLFYLYIVAGLTSDSYRDTSDSYRDTIEEISFEVIHFAKQIENAEIQTKVFRLITDFLVHTDFFELALQVAEMFEEIDERVGALQDTAKALAKAGQKERAKEVLEHALQVAEEIEVDWKKAESLLNIAYALGEAGFFDRAQQVAEGIEDASYQAGALQGIAHTLAQAGETEWAHEIFDRALQVAEGIEDASYQAGALQDIAHTLAQAGETEWAHEIFDRALQVVKGIEDDIKKAEALKNIAYALLEAGFYDRALQVAEGIEDDWRKAEAMQGIALTLAQADFFDRALQVAEGIEDKRKTEALQGITRTLAQKGFFDRALQIAEGIEEASYQAGALQEIARTLAQEGFFARALQVAEGVEDVTRQILVLQEIAQALLKAGEKEWGTEVLRNALQIAKSIAYPSEAILEFANGLIEVGENEWAREVIDHILQAVHTFENSFHIPFGIAFSLIYVAKVLTRQGEKGLADDVFSQALKLMEKIEHNLLWHAVLDEIIKTMVDEGFVERALQFAERIENEWKKAEVLQAIVSALAKAGFIDRALQVAERIENDWKKSGAMQIIAFALTQAGLIDRALQVAERIESESYRPAVLYDIAHAMAKAGFVDRALQFVEGIEEDWRKAEALKNIACGMAEAGLFDRALQLAEGIEAEPIWIKAEAMQCIARAMAQAGFFDRALQVAEGIEVEWRKTEALQDIAKALAKQGEKDRAHELFDRAMQILEGGEDSRRAKFAEALVEAGFFERALQVAEGIEDAEERANTLRKVAKAMAQAGQGKRAVEIAKIIALHQVANLFQVVHALIESDNKNDFKELLVPCAYYLSLAYGISGLLANLYPHQAEEILEVIMRWRDEG